jgi:predicted NodU family carbamoyl transferase
MLRKIFVPTIELEELKVGRRRLDDDDFHCYLMKERSWNCYKIRHVDGSIRTQYLIQNSDMTRPIEINRC